MTKDAGRLCVKHGGDCDSQDSWWICDVCARNKIDPCKCGSPARYFGEALMQCVSCESCDEHVMYVDWNIDIRDAWNNGQRGHIEYVKK